VGEEKVVKPDVRVCPICESSDIDYVGLTKDKKSVFRCNNCNAYLVIYILEPPFEVTIDE